jgi:uncharacterized protein
VAGETDLDALLAGMTPVLRPGTYVFATLPGASAPPRGVDPVATFREREGLTVVAEAAAAARAGLEGTFPCAWITLEVRSALEAIGFLARVAAALAGAGIPCNAVAAFHHDHLFVPSARARDALDVLEALSAAAQR